MTDAFKLGLLAGLTKVSVNTSDIAGTSASLQSKGPIQSTPSAPMAPSRGTMPPGRGTLAPSLNAASPGISTSGPPSIGMSTTQPNQAPPPPDGDPNMLHGWNKLYDKGLDKSKSMLMNMGFNNANMNLGGYSNPIPGVPQ